MTARKALLFIVAGVVMSSVTHAYAQSRQAQPLEQIDAESCCTRELAKIRAVASMPIEKKYVIRAFIDTSPLGKWMKTAGAFRCEEQLNKIRYTCDIYITKRLKDSLRHDDLMAVLAHEMGHIANQGRYEPGSLESEYHADKFAIDTLKKMGIDPRTLLTVLQELFRDEIFYSPEDIAEIQKRIQRIQELLARH